MRDIKKTSILLTIVRLIQLPLSLISSIIVARRLGPEGRGLLTLVLQVPTLMLMCAHFGIAWSSSYYYSKGLKDAATLVRSTVWFSFLSGLTFITIGIGCFPFFRNNLLSGVSWPLFLMAISFVPFQMSISNSNPLMLAQGDVRNQVISTLAHSILLTTLTAISLLAFKPTTEAPVLALVATVLIVWFLLYIRYLRPLLKVPTKSSNWRVIKELLPYGKWHQIGDVIQFINYRFDLFLVNLWLSKAEVGYYSLAFVLAEMLRIIPTAIGSALFPSLNSLTEEEATIRIPFIFRRLLVITLPTVLLFALLAYPMVELFYSAKFLATLPALYMILPGMAFLCVATPFSIFLSSPRYIRLPKGSVGGYIRLPNLSAAIAAVITIILDILLIPRLGIVGAAMASSLSYMALVITLIIFYLKITKTRLGELFRFHGDEFMVYKQLFEIIVKTVRR